MDAKNRSSAIQVLLTAAEREELHKAAQRHTLSTSSYARVVLLDTARREAKREPRLKQHLGLWKRAEA
jgi:hypothetical protein